MASIVFRHPHPVLTPWAPLCLGTIHHLSVSLSLRLRFNVRVRVHIQVHSNHSRPPKLRPIHPTTSTMTITQTPYRLMWIPLSRKNQTPPLTHPPTMLLHPSPTCLLLTVEVLQPARSRIPIVYDDPPDPVQSSQPPPCSMTRRTTPATHSRSATRFRTARTLLLLLHHPIIQEMRTVHRLTCPCHGTNRVGVSYSAFLIRCRILLTAERCSNFASAASRPTLPRSQRI